MNRIKELLQTALPPARGQEAPRDLWPELSRRIATESAPPAHPVVPWFDWAIAGGVALVAIAFPGAVPLFLYYL